ncbi:MAG: amino acid racemase [Variovorax sp.]
MDMAKTGGAAPGLLGVLGGMGPLATLDFMHKLLAATPAASDQEHVPVLVSSIPQVPDRTAAFRGEGASPLPAMIESGRRLVDAGAGLIVMPCNTAHLWFEPLQQALGLPMLHLVDAAIEQAIARTGAGAPLGLLATDATIASGLYLNRAPVGAGLHWLLPTAREMIEQVMPGIEAVKAGDRVRGAALLGAAAAALATRGARALVLGCTEIPLVLDEGCSPVPTIDATAALAQRCVAWSRGQRATGVLAA